MPAAHNGGARIHYETSGRGPAVLLIMGLAMAASGWWRTVPVLARSFRVLSFDNRGVGRSDSSGSYSMRELAEDAVAVLDASGEESAHVYGISLGGMIAQELALRHPGRVRSLVLGATTVGGPSAPHAERATLDFFRRAATMEPEEAIWASVPYSYAKHKRPETSGGSPRTLRAGWRTPSIAASTRARSAPVSATTPPTDSTRSPRPR